VDSFLKLQLILPLELAVLENQVVPVDQEVQKVQVDLEDRADLGDQLLLVGLVNLVVQMDLEGLKVPVAQECLEV
jgi:hypothetical protein